MTSTDDSELVNVNRPVASVQKLASAALCLVAVGLSVYAAVNDVWSFAAIFALGLALAVQSYRAVDDPTAGL
ncbi:hypothetical protein [Haloarcula salinisoli]|uniref:Uncharacterized protein n=1 Tax=Haloarcula salinisoli TaxID=2487746 RepID=A0A8J7YFS6_9EURY|nr:hypothetical protein [Halomicroarcula salinisoli]MBX0287748.1 hypothetical protein [Halomicroarcula salinisoli]MBX0304672.1 hypothetical protein [Halomicroarcula salinisoli]